MSKSTRAGRGPLVNVPRALTDISATSYLWVAGLQNHEQSGDRSHTSSLGRNQHGTRAREEGDHGWSPRKLTRKSHVQVDYWPFGQVGSFSGTQVTQNTLITESAFCKVGIAVGTLSWGSDNRTIARVAGGTINNNVFQSGSTGYFGFGITVSGINSTTFSGNTARKAKFGGSLTSFCFTDVAPLPPFQAFVADRYTTPGARLQKDMTMANSVAFPICIGPK